MALPELRRGFFSQMIAASKCDRLTDMDRPETISIDVYPWAAPTSEQRAFFDALSPEEKRRMIRKAIADGFHSGASEKSIDDIISEAHSDNRHAS
jgi:hypothetical protein